MNNERQYRVTTRPPQAYTPPIYSDCSSGVSKPSGALPNEASAQLTSSSWATPSVQQHVEYLPLWVIHVKLTYPLREWSFFYQ